MAESKRAAGPFEARKMVAGLNAYWACWARRRARAARRGMGVH